MTLVNCDELNIFVDWFRFCYLINTYNGNEMIFQVPILHRFDDALHFYEYMISYADMRDGWKLEKCTQKGRTNHESYGLKLISLSRIIVMIKGVIKFVFEFMRVKNFRNFASTEQILKPFSTQWLRI